MAQREGWRVSLVLALVFPAIMGAALALAYYGSRYAAELSRRSEASIVEGNREVADRLIRQIEKRIDEETFALFQDLVIEDPAALSSALPPTEGSSRVIVGPPVVLDERLEIAHPKGKREQQGWKDVYLKNLEWNSLQPWTPDQPGNFRYLHQQMADGKSVLISYARKKTLSGTDYYLAAKIDLGIIAREWLPEEVASLGGNRRIVIRDVQARPVFPENVALPQGDGRFLHDTSFGKTLYLWRVQLAPRNVEELQAEARRQQLLARLLIPLSTVILVICFGVILLSVRTERRASRLKSEFIANVSHELKTPLSLIRMFGEMIATGRHKGEGTARDYAGIITRESERLSHLIDNVLDFARLERGKASYDFADGQLADVVERTLDVCRYRLEKEKLRLGTDIAPDLPAVRIDENAMTLLLLNLVDNAAKYGAEGGRVDVALQRAPGGLVLSVRDRGPGIALDEQTRVFERFYRARSARDRNVRGSGIGLALVKHIADAHGGRVEIESTPGEGATFRVFVPAAPLQSENGEPGPSVVPVEGLGAAGAGGRSS